MPKDACMDMYRCMHFSNDWGDDNDDGIDRDTIYNDEMCEPSSDCAKHRRRFEHIKDVFNKHWRNASTLDRS